MYAFIHNLQAFLSSFDLTNSSLYSFKLFTNCSFVGLLGSTRVAVVASVFTLPNNLAIDRSPNDITLVVGILVTATTFAWSIINSRTKAFAVQEVQQNGRFILEKITQAAHSARDITTPLIGSPGNSLELVMNDVVQDPIIFSVNGGMLSMSEGGAADRALHSNAVTISSISFTNMSLANGKSKNVKITITVENKNPENRIERAFSETFTTTIELRDK